MSGEIQFCVECSNLLYAKEDKYHKQLLFMCRCCDYLQYADPNDSSQNCIYRLNYSFCSKEEMNSYIAQGLDYDPTLPRLDNWKCPQCPSEGAVYFQLSERVADNAMTLVYVCRKCNFFQIKGKETEHDHMFTDDILDDLDMNDKQKRNVSYSLDYHDSNKVISDNMLSSQFSGHPPHSFSETQINSKLNNKDIDREYDLEHDDLDELGLALSDNDDDNLNNEDFLFD